MINSYNDSFMKNFNGEEPGTGYNETFINKSNTNRVDDSYNRFFMNNTNTNDMESEYKNPFINNKSNTNYGDEYVKSFTKDFTPQEQLVGSNSFDVNNKSNDFENFNSMDINNDIAMNNSFMEDKKSTREITGIINNDMGSDIDNTQLYNNYGSNDEFFNNRNPNIRQENYNAPFGKDDDNSDGRYIRSFINGNNENNPSQMTESDEFIIRNQEIDKELSLHNKHFMENNNLENRQEDKDTNEHRGDFNKSPTNKDNLNYDNITFVKDIKEEEKTTYKDMFDVEKKDSDISNTDIVDKSRNIEGDEKSYNNIFNNNFNIDPSLRINAIQDERSGSYNKFFFNAKEDNKFSNNEESVMTEENNEKLDLGNKFEESEKWEYNTGNEDENFNGYPGYPGDLNKNHYYLDQAKLNNEFFNNFFNENKSEDDNDYSGLNPSDISNKSKDYDDETDENFIKIKYKGYDKPSSFNLNILEQGRINQEFFTKYFNQIKENKEPKEKEIDDNNNSEKEDSEIDIKKLDELLKKYREEEKVQETIESRNYNTKYDGDTYNNMYNENSYSNQYNNKETNEYNEGYSNGSIKTMENKGNLDYFNNEYINNFKNLNEDRRNKINYPQNPVQSLNNNEDRRSRINYPQMPMKNFNNSDDLPVIMKFNNKIESIKENQYIIFNPSGAKILRGDFNINSIQSSNDTIKLSAPGVYRVDIDIEYNFIVNEYLAGKDYQIVFILEDGNRRPIIVMNKVSPTSANSAYIADSFKKSEIIEVNDAPHELKLKLNNFSFSKQVPLDINNISILITKISN